MRGYAISLLLIVAATRPAPAQWYVGLEGGVAGYGGSARDTANSGGPPTFRPGSVTTVGIRIERNLRRVGVALRAKVGTPGLTATGGDLTVTDRSIGRLLEVTPVVALRLARVGPSGALKLEVGPSLALWDLSDEVRRRIAALGALVYEWPVGGRFGGAIRSEGAVGPSWFEPGDLPPEYERRPTWRYGVTLSLRYRL